MSEEERNREIIESVRIAVTPAFDRLTPEVEPAVTFTPESLEESE